MTTDKPARPVFGHVWRVRKVEWLLAAALFGVGVVYAFADNLFAAQLYRAHSRMMPRELWAATALFIGGLRLTFLYINGSYRRSPHFRALGAFLSSLAWLELTIAVLQAPILGATVVLWPLFLAFDIDAGLRAAAEAGISDLQNKVASDDSRTS